MKHDGKMMGDGLMVMNDELRGMVDDMGNKKLMSKACPRDSLASTFQRFTRQTNRVRLPSTTCTILRIHHLAVIGRERFGATPKFLSTS